MADQNLRVRIGLDVGAGGTIITTTSSGLVGIGTTIPTQKLHVDGNIRVTGGLYDTYNNVGTAGSVLISTGAGVSWSSSVGSGAQGSQGIQGTQGTLGSQGSSGAQGAQGTVGTTGNTGGVPYTFSTVTTDSDVGNGIIHYDSGTIGAVSFVYIDNNDANSDVQTTWYDTWDDSTSSQKGYLIIQSGTTTVNVWSITGAVTAAAGYYKIPVAHISGSLPTNGATLAVQFSRTGNQGSQGTSGAQGSQGTSVQGTSGAQGAQGIQGNNNGGFTITSDTTSTTAYIGFVTSTSGISTIVGIGSTRLQFNPSTGALGIGTIIDIIPYDTLNSGTLSWEGSAGQLFSITNNLTSGSIFSVNDVSGIPSIDVDANGTVSVVSYGGSLGIGTTNPTQKLDVNGNIRLRSGLYDSFNNVGAATSVLISTGTGTKWEAIATAALQGAQGTIGVQGNLGTQGTSGSQGLQGVQGLSNQGVQGVQGLAGDGGGGIEQVNIRLLTTGNYTPTANTKYAIVHAIGGGGGGGGADCGDTAAGAAGAGGGGGGTEVYEYSAVELGASATITYGAGGTAGSNTGGNGGAGGNTVFTPAGTGPTITGNGGSGGDGHTTTATGVAPIDGGLGGSGSGGTVTIEGGTGDYGFGQTNPSSGTGGESFFGAGGDGIRRTANGRDPGNDGTAPGSGGGGATCKNTTSGAVGGVGAAGAVYIIEYI